MYMDDMLIARKAKTLTMELKRNLHKRFSMKELGDADRVREVKEDNTVRLSN